jgi:hypothetical protein
MKIIWKKIDIPKEVKIKNILDNLKKKFILSHWIENIYLNKKNKIEILCGKFNFYRITVSELGFKGPTELQNIYNELKNHKFTTVPPYLALHLRFYYNEQKKGEWLRIATPLHALYDTDGIPHLPKLGQGLDKLFLETYWAYPKAIFHPHNDFVVIDDL